MEKATETIKWSAEDHARFIADEKSKMAEFLKNHANMLALYGTKEEALLYWSFYACSLREGLIAWAEAGASKNEQPQQE
jgi:hypothetical protein